MTALQQTRSHRRKEVDSIGHHTAQVHLLTSVATFSTVDHEANSTGHHTVGVHLLTSVAALRIVDQAADTTAAGSDPDVGRPSTLAGPRHPPRPRVSQRRRAAFTLAEVLAALAFMAIVIPVTIQGIRVASLAGQVSEAKAAAVRIADRVLNESQLANSAFSGSQGGTLQEGAREYRWTTEFESWSVEPMTLLTVRVSYQVQGQDYDVRLATLIDSGTASTGATTSSTPAP